LRIREVQQDGAEGHDAFHSIGLFATRYQVGKFVDCYANTNEIGQKSLVLPEQALLRRIHVSNFKYT
jgi:hypothetical protein